MEGGVGGEQQQGGKGRGGGIGEKGEGGAVSKGGGGGGGRQKLSPHSHNLPCGPRRVRVVFSTHNIIHHPDFKKKTPISNRLLALDTANIKSRHLHSIIYQTSPEGRKVHFSLGVGGGVGEAR